MAVVAKGLHGFVTNKVSAIHVLVDSSKCLKVGPTYSITAQATISIEHYF